MTTGVDVSDLSIEHQTIHRTIVEEDVIDHYLEPGEVCVSLDDPNLATDARVGVAIKSAANSTLNVDVKFGGEPIKSFLRSRLLWLGPID